VTPEEQEAVRRALAATPPAGPMPPEVVARLEATIADLAAESSATAEAPGATVSDLEERRRRRWPGVLVAAASVAVLGYGVGAVLQGSGPDAETAMSDSAGGDSRAESGADRSSDGGAAPQEADPPGAQGAPDLLAGGAVVELRQETLRRDVARVLGGGRAAALSDEPVTTSKRYARRDGTCALPELGPGDEVSAARLDDRRATLVLRRAEGGTRVAEVYWCGDGRTLLAETEVPARR